MKSAWFAVLLIAAAATHADAEDPVVAQAMVTPGTWEHGPEIVLEVADLPELPIALVRLVDADGNEVPARARWSRRDTDPSVAVAFVMLGQEVWAGNDELLAEDDPTRYPGVLHEFGEAFAGLQLARRLPLDSAAMIVTYADKARIARPMGSIATLGDLPFGRQRDYYGRMGTDLVPGVQIALSELGRARADRKVLFVLGDGNAMDNASAKLELAAMRQQAVHDDIEVHAIIYKSALSDPGNVVHALDPHAVTVNSAENMADAIADRLDVRVTHDMVAFPLRQPRRDGTRQPLTLAVGHERIHATVVTPAAPAPVDDEPALDLGAFRDTWLQLGVGTGLVAILALLTRWRATRPALRYAETWSGSGSTRSPSWSRRAARPARSRTSRYSTFRCSRTRATSCGSSTRTSPRARPTGS